MDVSALFAPRSIAVIGASPKKGRVGLTVIQNLLSLSYPGKIYPVNPGYEEVLGLECFPDVESIPGDVDAAAIAVGPETVPAALESLGRREARAAVVFAGGYVEAGSAGRDRQGQLSSIAAKYGIAICGPNCAGVASPANRQAMFLLNLPANLKKGSVGAICASGWAAISLLTSNRLTFSHVISTGNEAVVSTTDALEFLVEDPDTSVILGFLEGVKDSHRFISSLADARRRGKPVILLKVGLSSAGADAAVSHTGAVSGSGEVFREICRQHGAVLVEDLHQLMDVGLLFESFGLREMKTGNLGSVINSGGGTAMFLDLAEQIGVTYGELGSETRASLIEELGAVGATVNPVDAVNIVSDQEALTRVISLVTEDPNVDVVALGSPGLSGSDAVATVASAAVDVSNRTGKPVIVLEAHSGALVPALHEQLKSQGVPVLEAGLSGFTAMSRYLNRVFLDAPKRAKVGIERGAPDNPGDTLDEHASLGFLADKGFGPIVEHQLATSIDEVGAIANQIGFPVVMKVCSPDIPHKGGAGGVRIGIEDEDSARAAFLDLLETPIKMESPEVAVAGVLIAESLEGFEMFAGTRLDPVFGPTVTLGVGGVLVELLKDVTLRLAPITAEEGLEMIRSLRSARYFQHRAGFDHGLQMLAEMVSTLSRIAVEEQENVLEVDVNPIFVSATGAWAADALVLMKPETETGHAGE